MNAAKSNLFSIARRLMGHALLNGAIVAILFFIVGLGEVAALSQSENVALVPNSTGRFAFGGTLPTTGFPGGFSPTFTNVDPFTIGNTEDLSGFDTVVLVGICDIGSANFLGNPAWKGTIEAFVAGGGKLIIWDSECQNTDYSNFLLPFTTNNPGQLGAQGDLGITEENSLSRSNPLSPRFVDVALIGPQTDAVGDANVFTTQDPLWCVDMKAKNAVIGQQTGVALPTHTYAGTNRLQPAGLGDGLIIYDGLDKDFLPVGTGFGTGDGTQNLARVWLFELLQPFNPDGLPCGILVTCGNGTIDATEECDPNAQPTGCLQGDNCTVNDCVCVTPPSCGDGFIDGAEQCDPAAVPTGCSSGEVCNADSCVCEVPTCGNDQVEAGEVCDGIDDAACPGECLPPGDQNQCQCPICGDDAVNQPNEECDGIDQANCAAGCNPPGSPQECQCVAFCGDGTVDPGEECDDGNNVDGDGCSSTCEIENEPPNCSGAVAMPNELWPPNHKFREISVDGVTDPDGDPIAITIIGISQDEPLNGLGDGNTCPDASGVGASTASVRAERSGTRKVPGDGRVYHIAFSADDGQGGQCTGTVTVCVPHDQRLGGDCVDQGPMYDSTVCY
jgi:cysteine-rich repeat protein